MAGIFLFGLVVLLILVGLSVLGIAWIVSKDNDQFHHEYHWKQMHH
jgi:hypothetical protein